LSVLFIFYYILLRLAKQSEFIPLQNVVYFISLPFLVRKIFTFYINDVLLFKCPFPGPKDQRWSDRPIGMTKLIVAFRNFPNTPIYEHRCELGIQIHRRLFADTFIVDEKLQNNGKRDGVGNVGRNNAFHT
jgi:hypothetical protein